jgi:hypothetical protein
MAVKPKVDPDDSGLPRIVASFVERTRMLTDEDRRALARARRAVDETFHAGAWRSASEMVADRASAYVDAWIRIGAAFIPRRLQELSDRGPNADPAEVAELEEVARLTRAAIDDALLALLTLDTIPPPDIRELFGPWQAMLLAATPERPDQRSDAVMVPPPTTSSPE